jgi:hypothetical protein
MKSTEKSSTKIRKLINEESFSELSDDMSQESI